MKKIITMLLAILMVLSVVGCKNETANTTRTDLAYEIGDTGGLNVPFADGETISITGVSPSTDASNYIFEKLSEITGAKIEVQILPVSSYQEKLKVLISSKNLPDIIGDGLDITEINDLAMQGAFASVNDHLDEMPNFKRIFGEGTEENWVFKSYAAGDGKLYSLPSYDTSRDVNHGMMYRKDIFDKYGIEMWDSPESFYNVLKTLKEKDPECVPFSSKNKENLINGLGISWGIDAFDMYFDESKKEWKYSDTDPIMKELLDYIKKLYDEGLIDPEFLTTTDVDWTKKMTSNKSYVTYDWIGRMDMFDSQSTIEGYDLRYGNPIGPNQTLVTLPKVFPMMSVVANNDNAKTSMKVLDFLYSDAGAELMTLGIRGETFEFTEDGKAKYLNIPEDQKVDINLLTEKYGMFMQGTYRRMDKRSCYFNYTEKEQEAQDIGNNRLSYEPADLVLAFSKEDQETINDLKLKISTAFKEFMFKYILGTETGDAAWDKWIADAKALGVDKLVKIHNDTYKKMGF